MRYSLYLSVIALLFMLTPDAALARGSWWDYIFPPPVPDFSREYLNDAKTPHQAIYAMDPWTPEDWTRNRGSEKGVMDDLYINGIVTDQYMDDGIPVLQVGQHFMELSGNDKRRVAAYVDSVFGITQNNGTFILEHWDKEEPIGIYTKAGLQLQ